MRVALFALAVCLSMTLASAMFGQCPGNCALQWCSSRFGCTRCQSGFCVKTVNRYGVCSRSCGSGSFCNPVGFCNPCSDRNCVVCTGRRNCQWCRSGYTLSGNDCRRNFGR